MNIFLVVVGILGLIFTLLAWYWHMKLTEYEKWYKEENEELFNWKKSYKEDE